MKKFAALLPLVLFVSCAQIPIPFVKRRPKEPPPPPEPPPNAVRARKASSLVTPAPDFTFPAPGKARSLRSLRGQAVVIVIARNTGVGSFKKQLKELGPLYQELASKRVIFVAALQEGDGPVKSNIPFVLANDGAGVAGRYGVTGKFAIAIIGQDGNIDYQTTTVLPGGRVRDVIQNSFVVQDTARKR
ncbi:MAG: hypothetical protein ABIZ56_09955 [Chthoniobacteraceae bacterium]